MAAISGTDSAEKLSNNNRYIPAEPDEMVEHDEDLTPCENDKQAKQHKRIANMTNTTLVTDERFGMTAMTATLPMGTVRNGRF